MEPLTADQLATLAADDRSAPFRRLCIAFIVLPTTSVFLRFWSRIVANRMSFGWDDWSCLLALILSNCLCGVGIAWTFHGLGRHVATVPLPDIQIGLKLLFAGYYFFNIGLGVVKYSALFFYGRVFRRTGKFGFFLYLGHALVTGWLIFAIPSITFNCIPVQKFWNPVLPGRCLNTYAWYIASGVFDALLDLYVLVLPLPMLRKLQMKTSQKVLVGTAFVCGYCSLLASLGRLGSILDLGSAIDTDFTWNAANVLSWSVVEPAVGIISICLPSLFHIVRRVKRAGPISLFSTKDESQLISLRGLLVSSRENSNYNHNNFGPKLTGTTSHVQLSSRSRSMEQE